RCLLHPCLLHPDLARSASWREPASVSLAFCFPRRVPSPGSVLPGFCFPPGFFFGGLLPCLLPAFSPPSCLPSASPSFLLWSSLPWPVVSSQPASWSSPSIFSSLTHEQMNDCFGHHLA